MARRRGDTVLVYVEIGSSKFKYGFRTNKVIHEAYKPEWGQTTYAGATGVFFGANSPKPPKATKSFGTGTISSYCSTDKITSLKQAEWVVTRKGRIRGIKTSGRTRTVYVPMPGGWNYAWNITSAEVDLAADLGFTVASGADASNLIWGVNSPKPPRATKRTADGSVSTFIQPKKSIMDAAVGKEYSVSSVDYELLPAS